MIEPQKLKVAFDNFDEKGPLPNLNDSITYNNFYKNNYFELRTNFGLNTIPKIIMGMWIDNKVEFVKTDDITLNQNIIIYPIQFYCEASVSAFLYLSGLVDNGQKYDKFNKEFLKKINYILVDLNEEPISNFWFNSLKTLLLEKIPKEKIIFLVNNKITYDGGLKDVTFIEGVSLEEQAVEDYHKNIQVYKKASKVSQKILRRKYTKLKTNEKNIFEKKEKKFCILNGSKNSNYDFRQSTVLYLKKRDLLKYADYSNNTVNKYINYITDDLPPVFNQLLNDSNINLKNTVTRLDISIEKNSYFSLVLEAYFQSNFVGKLYITEKSIRPMIWKKPFIIIGQKNTLKGLQNIGYKTFHPFIDESYDKIKDNSKRFAKAMIEVEKLCNKSLDELHEFNDSIKEILEYNYGHINNRIKSIEKYLMELSINENI